MMRINHQYNYEKDPSPDDLDFLNCHWLKYKQSFAKSSSQSKLDGISSSSLGPSRTNPSQDLNPQSFFSSQFEMMSDNSKKSKDEFEGGDKENSISKTDKSISKNASSPEDHPAYDVDNSENQNSQHLRDNTNAVSQRVEQQQQEASPKKAKGPKEANYTVIFNRKNFKLLYESKETINHIDKEVKKMLNFKCP